MNITNFVTARNYVIIDVNRCYSNIDVVKSRYKNALILAVVKANCYGLGVELAFKIERKIDILGVATYEEGCLLRKLGIKKPILIFGYVPECNYKDVINNNLTLSIYSYSFYQSLFSFCAKNNLTANCHLKIDTGMHRFGIGVAEYEVLREILLCPYLKIKGIYSHLARSESDKEFSNSQKNRFVECLRFCQNFANFEYVHLANSYGYKDFFVGNTVRLGYGLYGGFTPFSPIVDWLARVVDIRILNKGESIGYGNIYVATTPKKIAVVSVGYGDGYPRESRFRYFLYKDVYLPVVGNICMDVSFVDTLDTDVKVGDYLTVIGGRHEKIIRYDDVGFGYEVLCNIGKRAQKIYLE